MTDDVTMYRAVAHARHMIREGARLPGAVAETAKAFDVPAVQLSQAVAKAEEACHEARARRPDDGHSPSDDAPQAVLE